MKSAFALCLLLFSVAAFAGDSDGGGGGALPSDPTTPQHIFDTVLAAKRELRLFLRYRAAEYARLSERHTALENKLYGGKRTILDLLETTDVEIRMNRPCFDKNGKAWDGSIYSSRPNAICISAFRLAPKLMDENSRKEVEALLLHELSHLAGTTEEEAVAFQKSAAADFKRGNDDSANETLQGFIIQLMQGFEACQFIEQRIDKMTSKELLDKLNDAENAAREYWPSYAFLSYNMLSPDEFAYHQEVQRLRLQLANWYAMGESDMENHQYWHDKYVGTFQGKSEITIQEFVNADPGSIPQKLRFPNEKIQRLNSKNDLVEAVKSFERYFAEHMLYAVRIQSNDALSALPGPWVHPVDHWSKFQGKYSVVDSKCKDDGITHNDIREFLITTENGQPVLKYNNGVEDRTEILMDGGIDFGESMTRTSGDEHSASRHAEQTTSWSKYWNTKDWKLNLSSDGFSMTRSLYEREQSWSGVTERKSECVYSLRTILRY